MTDKQTAESPGGLPAGVSVRLEDLVAYQDDAIVSRTLANQNGGSLTLFAFGVGQALSEHTAPFDAVVQVIDGQAEITVGGVKVAAQKGRAVLMPAGIPHAVRAQRRFKMLLTMIREVKG